MKERKRYTKEFKQEVLQMAASGERSIAELERDLGITPGMIYKWRDRYRLDERDGSLRASEEQEAAAECVV